MIPSEVRDVPVRRLGESQVLIGRRRPIPAEGEVIALQGSHVTIDPARPDSIPACFVTDLEAAEEILLTLYGADAVAAVGQLWSSGSNTELACAVAVGDELDQLTRLGVVRWCRQFSSLPLDDLLLSLEDLTLIGRLQRILEDEDEWPVDLERACGRLIKRTELGVIPNPAVESLLIEALELLGASLPVGDPVSIEARGRLVSRDPLTASIGKRGPFETAVDLPDSLALVARDDALAGADTVDWFDVPRGVTSRSEGNVQWALELSDASADVTVSVEGPPAIWRYGRPEAEREHPHQSRLAFDAYLPDWPFPALTGDLQFDASTWSWVGVAGVGAAQADLIGDALEAGHRPVFRVRTATPGPAQHPMWAGAHRWSCRALSTARVAEGRADWASATTAAWLRAAGLWRMIGSDDNADECEGLAHAQRDGLPSQQLTIAERWLLGA